MGIILLFHKKKYISFPSVAIDAAFKMRKVKTNLLTDLDIYLFIFRDIKNKIKLKN